MNSIREHFSNKPLLTFMAGHFTVDMQGGILPVLYPLMASEFNLEYAQVGVVALAYTGASSLSQPGFGYLADRFGSRYFAVLSLIWSAIIIGFIGFAPSFAILMFLAILAGLGSGAYHPQGASNASAAAGDKRRNSALALYTVGGTFGYSLGPILGALAFLALGRHGTIFFLPFGVTVALLMWRQLSLQGLGVVQHHATERAKQVAIVWRPLLLILSVVMLRSWVFSATVAFIPLWFSEQGYSSGFYAVLTTLVLAAGAAGTLFGGVLADRFGQRVILMVSMSLSIPFLLLFAAFPGWQSLLFAPVFAFLADMGISVTLVAAQRMLPGRVGVASGFILGVGFVTGGIGVPVTGLLAGWFSLSTALMLNSTLMLVAVVVVLLIPRQALSTASAPAASPA